MPLPSGLGQTALKHHSMTINHYKKSFVRELSDLYDPDEAATFFQMALEQWLGLKRIDLALDAQKELPPETFEKFELLKQRLLRSEPVQYLLGTAWFCGLSFIVDPSVLIPRPETEELVSWVVSNAANRPGCRILDIGTGSGCIAVSLAHLLPEARVSAIDISESALSIARKNAAQNGVEVDFGQTDVLSAKKLEPCDIIVSNPPYVREKEKSEMRANVLDNEPHLALFVRDDDALLFYRVTALLAFEALSESGELYFEINQYLGPETVSLVENAGFKNVELRRDMYGNNRMLRAIK